MLHEAVLSAASLVVAGGWARVLNRQVSSRAKDSRPANEVERADMRYSTCQGDESGVMRVYRSTVVLGMV